MSRSKYEPRELRFTAKETTREYYVNNWALASFPRDGQTKTTRDIDCPKTFRAVVTPMASMYG